MTSSAEADDITNIIITIIIVIIIMIIKHVIQLKRTATAFDAAATA